MMSFGFIKETILQKYLTERFELKISEKTLTVTVLYADCFYNIVWVCKFCILIAFYFSQISFYFQNNKNVSQWTTTMKIMFSLKKNRNK